LLILTAAAFSAIAVVISANRFITEGVLEEVYLYEPFDMHKNVIGTLAAFSALVVYARPPWLRWPRWATTAMFLLLFGGMLASQSRQALISVVVAVVLIVLRDASMSARSRAVLLPMFAAVVAVGLTMGAQFSEGNKFNSVFQRLDWYAQTTEVWQMNPWFGMGLRWWNTGLLAETFQPPQAILEVLSSAGILGLIGFVIMFGGFMTILWRRLPAQYGTLAVAEVLCRVVQGQLDQFWLTVQVSVPLIIVGICIGAYDHAGPEPEPQDEAVVVVD
ncbi:MAG: O-antigen ligase domain-containing protein, partial [Micrococcales bacterium]|nr:O-antigen ligase domain-containing protein [Micrococcales bacterium]